MTLSQVLELPSVKDDLALLQEYAKSGDSNRFAYLVEDMNWRDYSADDLLKAIDLSLDFQLSGLAVKLARQAQTLFPEHAQVQRVAGILAPPPAHRAPASRAHDLPRLCAWLHQYAGQFRGQWIALRQGQFVAAAQSLKELEAIVGTHKNAPDLIITQVI